MTQCLFCKIVSGEIPSRKVFENDELLVFHDINPAAPVHLLVIPKHHVTSMQDITEADAGWLGRMMSLIPKIAAENGCSVRNIHMMHGEALKKVIVPENLH